MMTSGKVVVDRVRAHDVVSHAVFVATVPGSRVGARPRPFPGETEAGAAGAPGAPTEGDDEATPSERVESLEAEEEGKKEALRAEEEEDGTIGAPPEEPPTETDTAGPVDSPVVGETVALGAGVPTAEGAAGLAPPVPGPSGAAIRAGAIPKPTIAISATTVVHHGFERLVVMIRRNEDIPSS